MRQYLEWYNKQNVKLMVPHIRKMQESFCKADSDIEIFRDNISLPNIARNVCFKSAEEGDEGV